MTRVLLTVDEGTGSLAGVRALAAAGYEPWIALAQRGTYVEHSRAVAGRVSVPSPEHGGAAFADAVAAAAREAGVDAVLPATEATLRALTGREAAFGGSIAVGTATTEALDRATDKEGLAGLAVDAGLRSPETRVVRSADDVGDASFPAVLKPLRSVATTSGDEVRKAEARVVETRLAVEAALGAESAREWLLQPYVRGTLGAVGGVAWDGRVVCSVQQVSHRIWPVGRGITAYGETVAPKPHLQRAVEAIVAAIGWSGVFQLQVIHADDGIYAIDFNPRIYGSTALAVAAGANLPAVWADLVLGREPRPAAARPGVRYRVEEDDLRALWVLAREGRLAAAARGLLPRRHTTHAIFSARDPRPALTTLSKLAARRPRSPARR